MKKRIGLDADDLYKRLKGCIIYLYILILVFNTVKSYSQNLLATETFTNSTNFSAGTSTTAKFWSPASCTTGGMQYYSSNGCTGGCVGIYNSTWNNYWGCFLRTPSINCSGQTTVTMSFDFSCTQNAGDYVRLYLWDNGSGSYKNPVTSVKINGIESIANFGVNGYGFYFTSALTCAHIIVTFNLSSVNDKSTLLFYIEPNCSHNNSSAFTALIDNVSIEAAAPPPPATLCSGSGTGGVYTVGASGCDFVNLTAVAQALNTSTVLCNLIFELQSNYSTASETFPVIFNAFAMTGGPWTAIIRPATGVTPTTSGSSTSELIRFDNASNIIFDGRPGGVGSDITSGTWTIVNTNTSRYNTFKFINNANSNILRYLRIRGNPAYSSEGIVMFGTSSTAGGGNSNNTVTYCYLGPPNNSQNYACINSAGSFNSANSGNIFTYNECYNFTEYGIYIPNSYNGSNWNISNNSFYRQSSYTNSNYAGIVIWLNSGAGSDNNTVSYNYIGGSQANCGGTAFNNGTTSLYGMQINCGTGASTTTVSNNILQNFTYNQSFQGIYHAQGNCNITNNIINNITLGGSATQMFGIYISSTGTTLIDNNTISNMSVNGATNSFTYGIYTSGANNYTITNNDIFNISSNSSTVTNFMYGIGPIPSGAHPVSISNNKIHNLTGTASASSAVRLIGIGFNGSASNPPTAIVSGNFIHNLSLATPITSSTITGIQISGGNAIFSNNMISLGLKPSGSDNGDAITTGYNIFGINYNATSSQYFNKFYFNSIYIGGSGITPANNTYAFRRVGTPMNSTTDDIKNNIFYNNRQPGNGTYHNYAISINNTAQITSNYNDLLSPGDLGSVDGGANALTFAGWQGGTRDLNSMNVDPLFKSPDGNDSNSDLHITCSSPVTGKGTSGTGIPADYDNEARADPPSIGADEPGSIPSLSAASNSPLCTGNTLSLTVTAVSEATYKWTGPNGFASSEQNPVISNVTASGSGIYTVTVTSGSCATGSITTTSVTVNPLPESFNLTGGGSYCSGGSGVEIGIADSQSGVNYRLKINNNDTGSPMAGTGGAVNFGKQITEGIYTVTAVNPATGCANNMTGSSQVSIKPLPSITGTVSASRCDSGSLTLGASASSGIINWYATSTGGIALGTGIFFNTPEISSTTIYYTDATDDGCTTFSRTPVTAAVNASVSVITQPQSVISCLSSDASFNVNAAGTEPLSYQWLKNNNLLPVYVNRLTINNISLSDAAAYSCIVRNVCGNVTSNAASLTIDAAPVIIFKTPDIVKCSRDSVMFRILTGSLLPVTSYQWSKNNINIEGATNSSYIISQILSGSSGNYTCLVSNACGSASADILLTVSSSPFIQDTIPNQSICEGNSITFFFKADGKDLKYQWTKGGSYIAGETNSSYSISSVKASDEEVYSCMVSNSCDTKILYPFLLSVKTRPLINVAPVTQTKQEGDSLKYSLSPGGTPPFSYQWKKDNLIIAGETNNSLKIKPIELSDAGIYSCLITNDCGSTSAQTGTLIVEKGTSYVISGLITYDDKVSKPMINTTVYLKNLNGDTISTTSTDNAGNYYFNNIYNGDYRIACKTAMKWGGVNPLDALLVNRYFIGNYTFGNSLRKKAADVSYDGKINPVDALSINRRFTGLISQFPAPDWLFETADVVISFSDIIKDIKSICAGDVDGSY